MNFREILDVKEIIRIGRAIPVRLRMLLYRGFRHMPVDRDKVLFFSYYGEQYSGSPKYISRYLAGHSDRKQVWAFTDCTKHHMKHALTVRFGHAAYYYHLATAGTIVTNYRMTEEFEKRKGQKYIQTWHSSLRLKRIEKDAEDTIPENYIRMAKKDSAQIDYLLAGSGKSRDIFRRAFWYDGPIVPTGTPQCDILFGKNRKITDRVRAHYGIPADGKIVLYAPTFRKNHDTSVYDLDTEKLRESLADRFGGRWYVLMRLHPHLIGKLDCFSYTETVLQATDYQDVQELLAAADFLVTDYSAIMFDFSVTRRPCCLYAPDLSAYTEADRKLYFEIGDLPFPCCLTNDELAGTIRSFDETEYAGRLDEFLTSIGSYDDGRACARVLDLISDEGRR